MIKYNEIGATNEQVMNDQMMFDNMIQRREFDKSSGYRSSFYAE